VSFAYPLSALVTLAALILYFVVTMNVGRARIKYQVLAPRTDGPEEFLRYFRVQMNTLEQIVLFLPLLWLAAVSVNDGLAAAIGVFWPVGRVIYARAYYRNPAKRGSGFVVGIATDMGLFLIALYGVCLGLVGLFA
jgi:glutathione S-transferase